MIAAAMHRYKRISASSTAALLLGTACFSPAALAVGLSQVFDLALRNDSTFLAATAENRAAQEFVPQAEARLRPTLSGDATLNATRRQQLRGRSSGPDSIGTGSIELNITQPLFRRDLVVSITQAGTLTEQADAIFAFALQDLVVRVAQRYFDVLAAEDSLQFAEAEREAIEQQLTQSQQRFEVGLIAITDVEEARAGFDLATARVIAAENQLDSALEALREVTGRYIRDLDELGDEVPLVVPEPNSIDAWTETALEQNWQLQATRLEVSRLRDEIRRVEAGHLPTLDLVGSSGYSTGRGANTGNTDNWDTSLGLRLNVPFYQGGLVLSQTREAQHRHQKALEDHERQRRSTQRLSRDSFRGVLSGISQVIALAQAVRSAQSALEAIEAGFQVGTRTSVDVLNAQRELFSARRDYSAARYDYILNILRLKQAAGTLVPGDLDEIDEWLLEDDS